MTIRELKSQIEAKTISDDLLIFKNHDTSNLIVNQYIQEIAKIKNLEIEYIDSLDPLLQNNMSLFYEDSVENDRNLRILRVDQYKYSNRSINHLKNVILIINKFESEENEKQCQPFIVSIPKLESWQIKDWVYSLAEGVPTDRLDWLISICGNNIDRIRQTIEKICLFNVIERKYLFESMIQDGEFDDITSFGIFNYTSAITNKDLSSLAKIYKKIEAVDINEFGLLKILQQNFKNLLLVQLNTNPTPENTGIEAKRLWAIKKQPRVYSPEQLVTIFEFICDIDRQVKEGELPTEIMRDYITTKILSL